MLASLTPVADGYEARFEQRLKHTAEKVWSSLTVNDKLAEWFPELRVEELREGGSIRFDMQDGTFKELEILELREHSVLEYAWGEDRVRFELYPEPGGCRLVLIETIREMTGHTPKDLAGWHVCLDVIAALLDGRKIVRMEEWKLAYEDYKQLLRTF